MTNLLLLGFLPSGSEWIIIALVILLLFGGKKIPELMKGLGKGVKSFKFDTLRSSGVWVGLLPFPQRSPNSKLSNSKSPQRSPNSK